MFYADDMEGKTEKRLRGRPRQFDKDKALEKAGELFRKKGYEATSLTDITETLGINKPSLYAAFGNKEDLFAQVLEQYLNGPIDYLNKVMAEKTSRLVVKQLLHASVDVLTYSVPSKGCLVIQSSMCPSLESLDIQKTLVEGLHQYEANLARRFQRAIEEGDLPQHVQAEVLARYITTLHKGMSVQAVHGADREALMKVVELVLSLWPGK